MLNFKIDSFSKKDLEQLGKLVEDFFDTKNDLEQLPNKKINLNFVNHKFQISLVIIKNNNKINGHTFILPSNKKDRNDFLKNRINEREFFYRIQKEVIPKNFDSLYLASAQILKKFRRKGIIKKVLLLQIQRYQKKYSKKLKLFYWPFSKEGNFLCEKIAKELNLKIYSKSSFKI